jgi:hypothetical protein
MCLHDCKNTILPIQHPSPQPSPSAGLNELQTGASSQPTLALMIPLHTTCTVKFNIAQSPKKHISSRSLTPANAARCLFPIEILNAVLNLDTGKLLEMQHLLVNPKYKDLWGKSYTTELGRLAQGIPSVSKGTDTIVFIARDEIPFARLKDVTYGHVCVNYHPKKDDPN